jgi:nickel-dependent lactate racemase
MRIGLAYGAGEREIELPDPSPAGPARVDVLHKAPVAPLVDPAAALQEALESPLGAARLRDLARGRRDAVIVVSDRTRPVPNALLLPPLLDALRRGGLAPDAVTVQIATGLHRPATAEELREILGVELARTLRVVQHDARDAASHVDLGRTRDGLPIQIDRFFVERDLRIVTGLVEPHLMAGYSGGRKAVCPGLASVETIRMAHGPAMLEGRVGAGILEGNPLHEALLEVVRKVGVHFSVQVALDRERRIAALFCGDIETSHEECVRFVEAESHAALDDYADLVVVSGGGAPLDGSFYQAIKGIAAAAVVVRPGGTILLCASLAEGFGSASFEKCLRGSSGAEEFEARLDDPTFFAIDQWMVQSLCQALRRARVLLYSDGLPRETQRELFVEPVASPEEGIARALRSAGPGARVAVLPQGPYVLATVRGEKRALGRRGVHCL